VETPFSAASFSTSALFPIRTGVPIFVRTTSAAVFTISGLHDSGKHTRCGHTFAFSTIPAINSFIFFSPSVQIQPVKPEIRLYRIRSRYSVCGPRHGKKLRQKPEPFSAPRLPPASL
jgi:hypothetical protein